MSLLLAASGKHHSIKQLDEGVIRIYDKYDTPDSYLLSSWKGLTDVLSPIPSKGKGVKLDWNDGLLAVGGNSPFVRIWDANHELCFSVSLNSKLLVFYVFIF
jgi:hypothetical protein